MLVESALLSLFFTLKTSRITPAQYFLENRREHWKRTTGSERVNIFQRSVVFHTETSHLICAVIQMTGFYVKYNTRPKWVNRPRQIARPMPIGRAKWDAPDFPMRQFCLVKKKNRSINNQSNRKSCEKNTVNSKYYRKQQRTCNISTMFIKSFMYSCIWKHLVNCLR